MGDIDMQLDDKELAEIDLEKLEEAYHKKELQSLPLEQLCKVHKVYLNSTQEKHPYLEVVLESIQTCERIIHKNPKEGKR
jgi:hypothetical protein